MKLDSRSFYGGMQEKQELGRISSKIRKTKFLDSDKKFLKIYSWFCNGVNIKHLKWDKRYSERGFKIFL